jgi:hypothetical protein
VDCLCHLGAVPRVHAQACSQTSICTRKLIQ